MSRKEISYTFLNFYMSALRNMFLTSSISLAMLGTSDKFINPEYQKIVKMVSFAIIVFAIMFGIKGTKDYEMIIKDYEENGEYDDNVLNIIKQLKKWTVFGKIYMGIVSIVLGVLVMRFIKNIKAGKFDLE